MNRIFLYITAAVLVSISASCISDDSDLETLIEQSEQAIQPIEIEFDYSLLNEAADEPITDPEDPYYSDYVENDTFDRVMYITFDGDNVTIDFDGENLVCKK